MDDECRHELGFIHHLVCQVPLWPICSSYICGLRIIVFSYAKCEQLCCNEILYSHPILPNICVLFHCCVYLVWCIGYVRVNIALSLFIYSQLEIEFY